MLESIADKWTILVVEALGAETKRFSALQAQIPGISHRMLTRTLRRLERDGLVSRTPHAQVPPRVDYTLTPLGRTLIDPVNSFIDWARNQRYAIDANRQNYDSR